MSTHAFIGVVENTGTLKYVYNHSDGYPSHLGKMLLEHYNTPELATALVNLGDISMVRERLAPDEGEEHSFKNPVREGPKGGVTTAYHRDRKDPLEICYLSVNTDDVSTDAKKKFWRELKDDNIEYGYLYDTLENQWYAVDTYQDCGFNLLNNTYISTHT